MVLLCVIKRLTTVSNVEAHDILVLFPHVLSCMIVHFTHTDWLEAGAASYGFENCCPNWLSVLLSSMSQSVSQYHLSIEASAAHAGDVYRMYA